MPIESPLYQFTILVSTALLFQIVSRRMYLPAMTGLLVLGMLLGPGGSGVLPEGEVIELLGELGLVFLMFLAGLEVDLNMVRARRVETISFGLTIFGLSLVPAVGVGLAMGYGLSASLLLGALISSHTLLAYRIVQQLGLLHRRPVVMAIGGTLITDTLALVLLAVLIQTTGDGTSQEGSGGWWAAVWPLMVLAGMALLSIWLVPTVSRWFFAREGIPPVQKALGVLALLMLFASTTELLGMKHILGAFLAGVCLNESTRRHPELREHIEFAGNMLFVPFFFISTGMLLKLEVFIGEPTMWLLALLLIGLVLVCKAAAACLTGWIFGYSRNGQLVMIGLTIPQAAATLAVAVTGQEMGLLGIQEVDAVIVLIFFTSLAGPLLTRFAGERLAGEELPVEEREG